MEKQDLSRFIDAQAKDYDVALAEIKSGMKKSHWMWYIFPQIAGLGSSRTSMLYSIISLEEAKAYLENEMLKEHLVEICQALLELDTNNATEVFGSPDDMKLKSSMTLFKTAAPDMEVFQQVLDKYYEGKTDRRTLEIISWRS